ncbi:MAG: ATP-binding protein [Dactylosporangium sp.]|nr:ATP-binding protein [Dactylosporangium sp.]
MTVAFRLALRLPRDASTVPTVRRLLAHALTTLRVADECRDDICLILTEACANVVEHAWDADDYEISAEFRDARCVIAVTNTATTADPLPFLSAAVPSTLTDRGRGLHIIRSLADEVHLTTTGGRLMLQAVITLRWHQPAPTWTRTSTDPNQTQ